jgi:nicotinamide mononucleotide transporter
VTPLEATAAVFGVISVYLGTRENILSWPTALVNVALYTVVYFVLSAYGWFEWKYGGTNRTVLRVSRATPRTWVVLAVVNVVAWVALGTFLSRSTNAALPWLDSLLSTTSLCAQWLMTRKVLEHWAIWIALDIVYVPTFISRGLYATAGLYTIFLVLAVLGWREWKRSYATTVALTPAPTAS